MPDGKSLKWVVRPRAEQTNDPRAPKVLTIETAAQKFLDAEAAIFTHDVAGDKDQRDQIRNNTRAGEALYQYDVWPITQVRYVVKRFDIFSQWRNSARCPSWMPRNP
jgi:hypothetical protein